MKPREYVVTVRGPVPADIGERIAAIHAEAIAINQRNATAGCKPAAATHAEAEVSRGRDSQPPS